MPRDASPKIFRPPCTYRWTTWVCVNPFYASRIPETKMAADKHRWNFKRKFWDRRLCSSLKSRYPEGDDSLPRRQAGRQAGAQEIFSSKRTKRFVATPRIRFNRPRFERNHGNLSAAKINGVERNSFNCVILRAMIDPIQRSRWFQ